MGLSYRMFPVVSAVTWGMTVSTMLIYWVIIGRPQYPTQLSPIIPYMSDVGAFTFKPFFEAGCFVASVSYLIALCGIHHAWYPRTRLSWTALAYSSLALLLGLGGAVAWVLQAIYDGFLYHARHLLLVHVFCTGVFFSAVFTSLASHRIGWLQAKESPSSDKLRVRPPASSEDIIDTVVAAFAGLLLALLSLFLIREGVIRGFLEWCLAYLLAIYLGMMRVYIKSAEDVVLRPTGTDTLR